MKRLFKWVFRVGFAIVLVLLLLVSPVVYVETACLGDDEPRTYQALLASEHHRAETRTLMTYPEWHIVHAYEDYAEVIRTGAPHDFGFFKSITGFWSSLCSLTEKSSSLGEIDTATKQMVYVIGTSFTLELGLKALYEETVGRVFVWLRGNDQSQTDKLLAEQAKNYAEFLQQVPWYKWGFREAKAELKSISPSNVRDRERQFSLGIEYASKAAYAGLIADAVANVGEDQSTLRMVVTAKMSETIRTYEDLKIIEQFEQGIVIETPRYRALTNLLVQMAKDGFDFVEIAGNDQIMLTVLSQKPEHSASLASMPRQGFGDYRHMVLVEVSDLATYLRDMTAGGMTIEHIHDY